MDTVRHPAARWLLALAALALVARPPARAEQQQAPRLSRIQGRAFLDRHRDVVGATVCARRGEDPTRLFVTTSDEKGSFRIEQLPEGSYDVHIEREGLRPVTKGDVELRFPFRAVVEIPMLPRDGAEEPGSSTAAGTPAAGRLSLSGEARAADGAPLAGVELRLVPIDRRADPRHVRTGEGGAFPSVELDAGTWRLEARAVGMLPVRVTIDLEQDTELLLSLVRRPASYVPTPLELMPEEQPIPPPEFSGSPPQGPAEPVPEPEAAEAPRTAK